MLYLNYPEKFSDDVQGFIDIFEYDKYKDLLLEDFVTSREEIMRNPVNCAYEFRSCVVIAEMFTTAKERFLAMNDDGYGFNVGGYKLWDGIVYEIIDYIYTSVHWESVYSARRPNGIVIPDGCIAIDTGSFHENWCYILRPVPDNQMAEMVKGKV